MFTLCFLVVISQFGICIQVNPFHVIFVTCERMRSNFILLNLGIQFPQQHSLEGLLCSWCLCLKKNDYKYVHLFLSTFFCPTASMFILISTLYCFVYHGSMFPLRYGKRPMYAHFYFDSVQRRESQLEQIAKRIKRRASKFKMRKLNSQCLQIVGFHIQKTLKTPHTHTQTEH